MTSRGFSPEVVLNVVVQDKPRPTSPDRAGISDRLSMLAVQLLANCPLARSTHSISTAPVRAPPRANLPLHLQSGLISRPMVTAANACAASNPARSGSSATNALLSCSPSASPRPGRLSCTFPTSISTHASLALSLFPCLAASAGSSLTTPPPHRFRLQVSTGAHPTTTTTP
ncbi:hypothetical protein B0H19DRAFT_1249184 [Mycena capillaripes]|nr:hypothetical protein B0H19DRAFT_1249184 [Mycena capillaripes]